MSTCGILYLIGLACSLGYFLTEQYLTRKRQNLPFTMQRIWIAIVISLIYPLSWIIIALDALGVDFDKHGI